MPFGVQGVVTGATLVFFAYNGFSDADEYQFLGGSTLFSGLSAGAHTFSVEVKAVDGTYYNNCTDQTTNMFELIAQEI